MVNRLVLAVAGLLLGGCEQFTAVEGTPVPPLSRPIVLMHRGAGAGNPEYRENTLEAVVYGASLYDGAEMDLQLGHDGTVWLGHDNEVRDCSDPAGGVTGGAVLGCFQELDDPAIDAVSYCDDATAAPCTDRSSPTCRQHYVRLAEVLQRFSTDPTLAQKLLALDVKDQLCRSLGLSESQVMADGVDELTRAYRMDHRLIVESDQVSFMREFRANGTPTYLFVEGYGGIDPIVEDAAREGATGISYRYTNAPFDPTLPEGLRNRGLRVMVWPVPQPVTNVADIPLVWAMSPDIIATDRSDFLDYVTLPNPF